MQPYQPRRTAALDPMTHGEWTLKSYSIVHDASPFDASRFAAGLPLALACLPSPAITPARLGVGFVIQHQGRNIDDIVLGWWDRENELPLRVFVRDPADGDRWRPAKGSESVCVWDLEVIWNERQTYIATILGTASGQGRVEYLSL
jgi:hypothetical protein